MALNFSVLMVFGAMIRKLAEDLEHGGGVLEASKVLWQVLRPLLLGSPAFQFPAFLRMDTLSFFQPVLYCLCSYLLFFWSVLVHPHDPDCSVTLSLVSSALPSSCPITPALQASPWSALLLCPSVCL